MVAVFQHPPRVYHISPVGNAFVSMVKHFCLFFLLFLFSIHDPLWAGDASSREGELRYLDADGDGKNDLFRDANGDGINDIDGKPYRHKFNFIDTDGDGINDVFQDTDGDGINNVKGGHYGKTRGENFSVIDFNEDGINDVTGKQYMKGINGRLFIDEDGDGLRDMMMYDDVKGKDYPVKGKENAIDMDKFKDLDNDGINDGRGFGKGERGKGLRRGKK